MASIRFVFSLSVCVACLSCHSSSESSASTSSGNSSYSSPSIVHGFVIGALIPKHETIYRPIATLGFLSAIQDINNDPSVLPHHKLQPVIRDTGGDTWLGFQQAVTVIGEGAVAVVGPGRSTVAEVVSPLSSRCQIPFVTPSSTSLSLSLHEVHRYLIQLCPSSRVSGQVITDVLHEFGWKYIAIIKSDGEHGKVALYYLEQLAKRQGLHVIKVVELPVYPGNEKPENRTATVEKLKMYLQDLVTLRAHVFVLSVLDHHLELVLQAADQLRLIGDEFVWIVDRIESPEQVLTPKLLRLLRGSLGISTSLPRSVTEWERKHNVNYTSIYQLYTYDSVWLIAHALHRFVKDGHSLHKMYLPSDKGLPQLYKLVGGELLLEYMQNTSFEGISGMVLFDGETGERQKEHTIVNMFNGTFSIVGKWSSGGSSQKSRLEMGGRYPLPKWYNGSSVTPADRDTSTSQVISALAIVNEPFIYHHANTRTNNPFSGYLIDLMNELSERIGFRYKLTIWNNSYDKAIEYISQGNHPFTLVVADMSITARRSQFVQFSSSYLTVAMCLLIKRPDTGTAAGTWGFLAPLSYGVWLIIIAFFLFGAIVLRITEHHRRKSTDLKFGESLWISFSCAFGTHKDDLVTSQLGRVWLLVVLLILMVLTSVYTANLTSFLLSKELKLDVTELQDLLDEPVGAISGTASYRYLTDVEGLRNLIPLTVADAPSAIVNGTVKAFIADKPVVQHIALHNCSVYVAKIQFHPKQLALAFQRGSALLDPVNTQMQSFWESGYLSRLYDRHFVWYSKCNDPEQAQVLSRIGVEEFKGIFIVVAITTAVCLLGRFVTKTCFPSLEHRCMRK